MFKKFSIVLLAAGCCILFNTSNAQIQPQSVSFKKVAKVKTFDTSKSLLTNDVVEAGLPVPDDFIKSTDGLDYKIIVKGTGTQQAMVGDFGEMNVIFKIGDTVMINTMEMNNNMPVPQQFQTPSMQGDLMEGLLRMKAGDSVVFRMLMDTLAVRAHQPKPNWVKAGDYATWHVKMVSIKTKAQMEAATLEKDKIQLAADDKILQDYFKEHKITNVKKTASGLYYTISKKGGGVFPKEGQEVKVNYTGRNLNGEKFDSNVLPEFHHVEAFSFALGKHNVIKGWDEGVALMNKGMKATFYIPSILAYGERGAGEKIAPNAILIFDIELLSFK